MDIKDYIASGILENYVFGHTSAQETQEIECMSHIYPEIKEQLTRLQKTIENLAEKYATPPPRDLKFKILAQIQSEVQIQPDSIDEETKIVPISRQPNSGNRINKLMAAASIVALIGLGTYTYFIKTDLNQARNEFTLVTNSFNDLQHKVDTLNQENNRILDQFTQVSSQMDFIRDQHTKKIELTGTPAYAANSATVFWNNSSEKVMLDIKNLPQIGSDESYQLWVLIGGVPQDMGVFEFEINADSLGLIEMKSTGLADAFAITREPKGGSVSPTLENLHVIGTI